MIWSQCVKHVPESDTVSGSPRSYLAYIDQARAEGRRDLRARPRFKFSCGPQGWTLELGGRQSLGPAAFRWLQGLHQFNPGLQEEGPSGLGSGTRRQECPNAMPATSSTSQAALASGFVATMVYTNILWWRRIRMGHFRLG